MEPAIAMNRSGARISAFVSVDERRFRRM